MDEKYIEINTYIDNLATYLNQEYPNILIITILIWRM